MAAFAALGVNTHRDAPFAANPEHPLNEIPAFNDQKIGRFCPISSSSDRVVPTAVCPPPDTLKLPLEALPEATLATTSGLHVESPPGQDARRTIPFTGPIAGQNHVDGILAAAVSRGDVPGGRGGRNHGRRGPSMKAVSANGRPAAAPP